MVRSGPRPAGKNSDVASARLDLGARRATKPNAWRRAPLTPSWRYTEGRDGQAARARPRRAQGARPGADRKSTRLNSSHVSISYAVFCLNKNLQSRQDKEPPEAAHLDSIFPRLTNLH